jgi:DNA excision repair protein ERCC-4
MNITSEIFKELKKCTLLEDDYDLDAILLMKININYNTLSAKARQLVNDLRTLRSLLRYLLCYDCIAFYEYLVNILESANKEYSAFVLVDNVDLLLKTAKDRIVLQDKLDYNPKYEVLEDILKEIRDTTVLITTSDSKSAKCIMEYLKGLLEGDKKLYIKKEYNRFMKIRKDKKKDDRGTKSSNTGRNNHPATSAPGGRFNKRRRVRGGAASVVADRKKGTAEQQIEYLESITNVNGDEAVIEIMSSSSSSSSSEDEGETKKDETIRTRYFIQYKTLKIYIHVYSSSVPFDDEQILYNLNPPVILMFDPNPTFIRQIEVYKALNKNKELKVHFMVYEESYEEQLYLTKLKDEKLGFEKLIREKSQMMFQKAKDKVLNNQHGSIVIDTREFRSSLPMVLYTKGFQIIPATIEVGDYVLTKDICVERKSVPDLIGSFASGRLYTQVENMCHHYKTPVLLIEFDENRGFTFDLGRRYYKAENDFDKGIEWKLVLLSMNFPQLRIIWSGSLHASVEIFMDLKQNKEDPDIDTVLGTGQDTLVDTEDLMSIVPVEVLQQLPGMVPVSYKYIIKEVKSLKELVSLNEDKLEKILGNKEKAKALHEFMNKSV